MVNDPYQIQMQKESIIESLKKRGYRITRQRRVILDLLFENRCATCKELRYRAVQKNQNIGMATIYRMLDVLEQMGAITKRNSITMLGQLIQLDDETTLYLSDEELHSVIRAGLDACGYTKGNK